MILKLITFICLFITQNILFAKTPQAAKLYDKNVAKLVMLRGQVAKYIEGETIAVQKGDQFTDGEVLVTGKRSFAQLMFIDGSKMVLGADSTMKINRFGKEKVSVISLARGALRAKVPKNKKVNGRHGVKMIIKSKTAALGVRGTEFHMMVNRDADNVGVLTYEGLVNVAKLDTSYDYTLSTRRLVELVSSPLAVPVPQGTFSGLKKNQKQFTRPTRISPRQFELLQRKEVPGRFGNSVSNSKFKSPIPPNVAPVEFQKTNSGLEQIMKETVARPTKERIDKNVKFDNTMGRPEGTFIGEKGFYTPPAGGFVDFQTSQYVAPPAGSSFDPTTNTYTPPPEMGEVDPVTGGYLAPSGYELTDNGNFKIINEELANSHAPPQMVKLPEMGETMNVAPQLNNPDDFRDYDRTKKGDRLNDDKLLEEGNKNANPAPPLHQLKESYKAKIKVNIKD